MSGRRWPLVAAAIVAALAVAAAAWAAGRASAPDAPTASDKPSAAGIADAAVRVIDGIPIGVQHSRAGALAASDNYVATSSETLIQDPERYERFVRAAYVPTAVSDALALAQRVRDSSPDAVSSYAAGGRGLTVVGARRLEAYDGRTASVETWAAGIAWGPKMKPSQRWYLARTRLRWDGQRWRIDAVDELDRPAPAPASVVVTGEGANRVSTFDRELGRMEAPIYGSGG
jgi:hypothetical protein